MGPSHIEDPHNQILWGTDPWTPLGSLQHSPDPYSWRGGEHLLDPYVEERKREKETERCVVALIIMCNQTQRVWVNEWVRQKMWGYYTLCWPTSVRCCKYRNKVVCIGWQWRNFFIPYVCQLFSCNFVQFNWVGWLVGWSLTSLLSINRPTAVSETKFNWV